MKKKYSFEQELSVRDYECDLQGIVNNAVYQNYLEHTRHEYIKTLGLDFAELHRQKIDPVVYNVNLTYKKPLKSGDTFVCKLRAEKEGHLKIIFRQDIYKKPNNELVLKGKVTTVILKNGRPVESSIYFPFPDKS